MLFFNILFSLVFFLVTYVRITRANRVTLRGIDQIKLIVYDEVSVS